MVEKKLVVEENSLVEIPKEVLQEIEEEIAQEDKAKLEKELAHDVQDLNLVENVFDKRVTKEQIDQEVEMQNNQSNSSALIDKKDVEVKTELNNKEIFSSAKLLLISDRYQVPLLETYLKNVMTLKISKDRQGRKEFIQGLHADERREQPPQTMWQKIFGGGQEGSGE